MLLMTRKKEDRLIIMVGDQKIEIIFLQNKCAIGVIADQDTVKITVVKNTPIEEE